MYIPIWRGSTDPNSAWFQPQPAGTVLPGQGASSLNSSTTSRGVALPFGAGRPFPGFSTGISFDPLGSGGVGFDPQATNANSPQIKFGYKDPQAEIAARTPVSRDLTGDIAAGGGSLKWDPTHQQWYREGGTIRDVTPQQRQDALAAIDKQQNTPIGTAALNQFNQRFGNPQQSPFNTYRPIWG